MVPDYHLKRAIVQTISGDCLIIVWKIKICFFSVVYSPCCATCFVSFSSSLALKAWARKQLCVFSFLNEISPLWSKMWHRRYHITITDRSCFILCSACLLCCALSFMSSNLTYNQREINDQFVPPLSSPTSHSTLEKLLLSSHSNNYRPVTSKSFIFIRRILINRDIFSPTAYNNMW